MSKAPAHRFAELDLLRGFACATVVAYHYLSRGPRAHWMTQADYPMIEPIARYGYLGVHLFFMISGFVILMSARGATPRQFLASRVSRLVPALWAGATLTAASAWLLGRSEFAVSLPHFIVNLTMLPHWFGVPYVDGVYWSLAYELHFYIYVWIALRFRLMSQLEWLLIGWLLVSTVNAVRPMWPVQFWLDAKWAPLFVAGAAFYLVRMRGTSIGRFALLAWAYSLSIHYSVSEAVEAGVAPISVAAIITSMFAVMALISSGRFSILPSRVVVLAGVLTYPVYLIHQFFGMMLYEQIRDWTEAPLISLVTAMLLVVAISTGIHFFIEKPLGRRLRAALAPHSQRGEAAGVY